MDIIKNLFGDLDLKEYITLLGIAATFIVSSMNLRNTKRNNDKALFINTITKERLDSMKEFKSNLANLFSMLTLLKVNKVENEESFLKEYYFNKNKIIFQFNPLNENENLLCKEIDLLSALVEYRILFDRDSQYVMKIINEYNINIEDFYVGYRDEKDILTDNEFKNKLVNNWESYFYSFLDIKSTEIYSKMRIHLKDEWNKAKIENKKIFNFSKLTR